MEDLVEPESVMFVTESTKTTIWDIHQKCTEDHDTDHDVGEDFNVGHVKVVKKRLPQISTSESDDDKNNEDVGSPAKVSDKSDDKSRLLISNQHIHITMDDTRRPMKCVKKRIQLFSDSESDCDKENKGNVTISKTNSSDSEEDLQFKNKKQMCRIKIDHNSGSSDSGSSANEALKNEQQQLRMKNKRSKLKDKFKSLVTSRLSESNMEKFNSHSGSESEVDNGKNEVDIEQPNHEEISIERIKQKIKNKTSSYKTTICDPDTSDEENDCSIRYVPKNKERKTAILTSPKPVRMTAKQAMENMKKIKSESNRMLREKEVTLPYHRPKALSLKDIMSRRKPAVSSDGKSLPLKMNEEQLKQYAKILEVRQKEMMELCKSDTDDDPEQNKVEQLDECNVSGNQKPSEVYEELKQTENKDDNIKILIKNVIASVETDNNIVADVESVKIVELKNNIDETSAESDEKEADNNKEKVAEEVVSNAEVENNPVEKITATANDSMNSSTSNAEMSLVYNDSIEETNNSLVNEGALPNKEEDNEACKKTTELNIKQGTELNSQLVSLHYDSEKLEIASENMEVEENEPHPSTSKDLSDIAFDEVCRDEFSDDDMINMDEIDNLIENADILKDNNGANFVNSPMLINDPSNSIVKPKLGGAPGMVIDLDGTDAVARKKITGLELLKERFTYFAKLKTPEEREREKEKRLKPGAQHLKLKHELEEIIAEQRSLEWAKRLEEEKKQQMEMDAVRGDESEDEIEKIEAKLDDKEETLNEESSESEESEEDMQEIHEKPRKTNPMIDDEAEVSDDGECVDDQNEDEEEKVDNDDAVEFDAKENNDEESDDSSEDSSDSEEEPEIKTKKGRILKAFEDSDEEDDVPKENDDAELKENPNKNKNNLESQSILDSQDEVLQLAQRHKSLSGDLFTSQESANTQNNISCPNEEPDIGTQTFSIVNASTGMAINFDDPEKLNVISETQPSDDPSLDAIVGMCSGSFTQNLVDSQIPSTGLPVDKFSVISKTQPNYEPNLDSVVGMCSGSFTQNLVTTQIPAESQPIGEDILNLCTGKFYDNEFVSQTNNDISQKDNDVEDNNKSQIEVPKIHVNENEKPTENKIQDDNLKSILDELNDPEFEEPKPMKFFMDKSKDASNTQFKKKFIIDSDDETYTNDVKQKKKIKKKKLEKRALQISDDEEDECDEQFEDDEEQEDVSDAAEDADRLVEYDSEENEVEMKPQKEKIRRKMAEFFEQEAELSEEEWAGSGDEDEAGLDRLEREDGDDERFDQRRLQRELGQIHMRDVLDQDKREVRLIQELLFEDGDLGDGHRQRKFRWRNADGEEEGDAVAGEPADTQEEELESEELWRRTRHERELFLRGMQKQDDEELNVTIDRTTIIKANLYSRTMSSVLFEAKTAGGADSGEKTDSPVVLEKKSSKDIPSPKKAFTVFQQQYHGSLLSRGGPALARLAALAAPLAGEDAARPPPASARNFVFAALSQPDPEPKVTKRKAETNVGTPRLVKKMKTEDKKKPPRSSLLDHLKV